MFTYDRIHTLIQLNVQYCSHYTSVDYIAHFPHATVYNGIYNRQEASLAQITLSCTKGLLLAIYYHWHEVKRNSFLKLFNRGVKGRGS